MQNIEKTLLKYGILPSVLSQRQSDNFSEYVTAVTAQEFSQFYDFLENLNNIFSAKQNGLNVLHSKLRQTFCDTLEILNDAIPDKRDSLLSAFGNVSVSENFHMHCLNMIFSLSEFVRRTPSLLKLCNSILSSDNDTLATEFTLRHIALTEFASKSELCSLYQKNYEHLNTFFRADISARITEYSELILLFESKTKEFCSNIANICEPEQQKISKSRIYGSLCNEYAMLVHDLSLKLSELHKENNIKI